MDYEKLRKLMVEEQLIPRGIKDKAVLDAMLKVPRHVFVPWSLRHAAYDDRPLPIGEGQTISQPYMVTVMTELLEVDSNSKILEIGTGSGYQTAVIAEIAKEVYTVERIEKLSDKAKDILIKLGYKNIHFKVGDGTLGWEEFAPYNGILVTAAAPYIPETLKAQLSDNGKIVIPVGEKFTQKLIVVTKKGNIFLKEDKFFCAFVPLIGKEGWKE
jgi:protein-L-isoaspartate(D-aspartate) O-methyltransferase